MCPSPQSFPLACGVHIMEELICSGVTQGFAWLSVFAQLHDNPCKMKGVSAFTRLFICSAQSLLFPRMLSARCSSLHWGRLNHAMEYYLGTKRNKDVSIVWINLENFILKKTDLKKATHCMIQ